MTRERSDYLPFGKPDFTDSEAEAVVRVLRTGWVGMGAETEAFEEELAQKVAAPHVVTVNSCTSALFLSLRALGIGPGDEVICPSLTWCATANAALYLGATPVFCDIEPETLSAGPGQVAAKVTSRTRAAIVVHFGGLALDIRSIREVLPDGVALIEDAAHAMGARFTDGMPVGGSGNLTCFSFYANKNLSTGEGGAIAVQDEATASRLRSLRQNGLPANAWQRFTNRRVLSAGQLSDLGYKMNFTDLQSAIGRVQLARQAEMADRRLRIAEHYTRRLSRFASSLSLQKGIVDPFHARHLYVLTLREGGEMRDRLLLHLRSRNVGASIHYPPLHQMPLYEKHLSAGLDVTERVAPRLLTLPMSASMTLDDADYVADELADWFSGGGSAGTP